MSFAWGDEDIADVHREGFFEQLSTTGEEGPTTLEPPPPKKKWLGQISSGAFGASQLRSNNFLRCL